MIGKSRKQDEKSEAKGRDRKAQIAATMDPRCLVGTSFLRVWWW